MKYRFFASALTAIVSVTVGACAPAVAVNGEIPPTAPIATNLPAATLAPTPTPSSGLSFVAATYKDEVNGFVLDYPADWSASPSSPVGSRGSQAQLFSPGTTAEALAPGGSRLSITVFQWDPKNDLQAFVNQRRGAWEASGLKVSEGSVRQLVDGRPASDFFTEAPDGARTYFLLTTNGGQYLQLAGEGDLALIEEISRTLRPIDFKPG